MAKFKIIVLLILINTMLLVKYHIMTPIHILPFVIMPGKNPLHWLIQQIKAMQLLLARLRIV